MSNNTQKEMEAKEIQLIKKIMVIENTVDQMRQFADEANRLKHENIQHIKET